MRQSNEIRLPVRTPILLCAVALFPILTHLTFLALLPTQWRVNQSTDYYKFYEPVARNIVLGNGLVTADGAPALEYPPGFPFLLAAAFETADLLNLPESLTLHLETILYSAIIALLIFLIAAHVFDWRLALAAVFVWSTYPLQLWQTKQPDNGQPFTILLLLSIYLFLLTVHRHPGRINLSLFVIGVLAGLGSLIRPIGIGISLIFLLALCLFPRQKGWKGIVAAVMLLVSGNLLAIAPWEIWARRACGCWIPLSTNGPASMFDGVTFSALREPLDLPLPAAVRSVIQDYVVNVRSLLTTDRLVRFTAAETVRHPAAMAELAVIKAARVWYGTDSRRLEKPIALLQSLYLLLSLSGLMAVRKHPGPQSRFALLVILFTGYFWAMSIMALSIVRYMMPVMALVLILAAAGPWDKLSRKWGPHPTNC